MSTNDEREALDRAALTAARAIYGNSFDPAVHVVQFDTMRQAARAILASLPAPHSPEQCANIAQKSEQAPATGGDAVPEGCVGTMGPDRATYFLERFKREERMLGPHEQWALNYAIAALANHSPDAGGVGKDVIERISQRIAVFADMKPEEDEDWESWYAASFDMLSAEVAALRPGLRAGGRVMVRGAYKRSKDRAFEALRREVVRVLDDYGEDRPDWQYQPLMIEMVHCKALRDHLSKPDSTEGGE